MDFEIFKEMVENAYTDIIMTRSVTKDSENAGVCKLRAISKDSKGLEDFLIVLKLLVHEMTVDMNALILPSYKRPLDMIEIQGYSFFKAIVRVLEAPCSDLPLMMVYEYGLVNSIIEYRLKEGI